MLRICRLDSGLRSRRLGGRCLGFLFLRLPRSPLRLGSLLRRECLMVGGDGAVVLDVAAYRWRPN